MKFTPRAFSILAMCLFLVSWNAHATHEADHRYNVRGYVYGANGQPRADVAVSIHSGGKSLGGARTDGNGYYSTHLHLHDADLGKPMEIRAGSLKATIRMRGTIGDKTSARVHNANFVGDQFNEDDLGSPGPSIWIYGGIAALLAAAVLANFYRRRRKRAARAAAKSNAPGPKRHKAKAKKRKKH